MSEGRSGSQAATWMMIAGGFALAAFTFLTWYDSAGVGLNAWEGLRRSDVVIFAAGVVAGLCGVWLGFGDVGPERRAVALIGLGAAALGALVVVVRLVSPPGEASVELGIFLALLAAIVAGVGSLMAITGPSGAVESRPGTGGPAE